MTSSERGGPDPRATRRAVRAAALAAAAIVAGCGGSHHPAPTTGGGTTMPPKVVTRPAGGGHTMAVTVNGATCSAASYANKPCVEVTVCEPGGSSCVAIGDILLDTGSYGLRVFSAVLPLTLPQVTVGGRSLASCVQFADGSADWGPIRTAEIYLGDAGPVTSGIQVIDAGFAIVPGSCGKADTSPVQAGLNGVLGVGPFVEDCGAGCASSSLNGLYYGCTGTGCLGVAVPLAQQVKNPAALLSGLGNGLVVDLPGVGAGGAPSVSGNVYFGIGAWPETATAGVSAYPISLVGGLPAVSQKVNGTTGNGFLDTGSNALYFTLAGSGLAGCTAPNAGFYCPATTFTLNGSFYTGSAWGPAFTAEVANLNALLANPTSNVFDNIAGTLPGVNSFDWGLPFYLGRRIYQGMDGQATPPFGTGPFQGF